MIAQNWTVRGEYLYYNFSGASTNPLVIANICAAQAAGITCGVNVTTASNNINTVRLGVNFKW